jgi:hypothetical protein
MGLDLRLLPCEHWHERDGKLWGYSHTILDLGGVSEDAWHSFEATVKPHLVKMPAGHDVSSYVGALVPEGSYHAGERIYGTIRDEDAYGTPYEVVSAEHLLPWLVEHFQYDGHLGRGPYQASIVAYIRALPTDTKIVLDWH